MIVFLPQVVDEYTTGEIGSVYNDQKWTEVSHTFRNYGPGVRIVSFSSKGELSGFENYRRRENLALRVFPLVQRC